LESFVGWWHWPWPWSPFCGSFVRADGCAR